MTVFTGTLRLARLALRRDRVLLPVWLVAISLLTAGVVTSVTALYTSAEERAAGAAFGAANTVARIFDGPASGTELGAMAMVESYGVLAIFVALMSAQAVVRHTRQEEETGRAELVGAAVVGRYARLSAALLVATGANVVVAAAVAAVLLANDLALAGAIASGGAVGALGVSFAAVAAVTAQLSGTQRGANALAGAALGISFVLRAVGDAFGDVAPSGTELRSAWPSWLSPIGWGQQVRPFHQDNWTVFGLYAVLVAALVVLAFVLTSHRDFGAGVLSERAGPPTAAAGLGTPWGLAWRLQRAVLLTWLVGMVVLGVAFGAVGDSVDDFAGISDQFVELLQALAAGSSLVDLYFAFMMAFLGVAAAGYTVQALLRLRADEDSGRLEPVLATAVGRAAWLGSHVVIAGLGTVVLLLVTGLSGALAYGAATGDLATGMGQVAAALAQVPAALALGGFVVAAFALLPQRVAALSWAALAASLVVGQLGDLLELPQPVMNLSPFTHVPRVPAESLAVIPLGVLLAVAGVLTGIGFVIFRRRDLALGA